MAMLKRTRPMLKRATKRMRKTPVVVRRRKPLARKARSARLSIGQSMSQRPSTKQRSFASGLTPNRETRTLYKIALTEIPFGSATNNRAKNKVLIKGIRIKWAVRNKLAQTQVFRWAVIAHKTGLTIPDADFFHGGDAERGLLFSTLRSGIQMTTSAINPDIHAVLAQGKVILPGSVSNDNANNRNQTQMIRRYVRINRVLTWDESTAITPNADPIWLVFWSDDPMSDSGALVTASAYDENRELVTYFMDD